MPLSKRFPLLENEPGNTGTGNPPAPSPEPTTFSREYVTELRGENKAVRLKNDTLTADAAVQAAASAKAGTDHADAIKGVQTAADARIVRSEMKAAALKAGMVDLDGLKLADLSKVKLNADGEVEGADELMADMKKAKPYLFGAVTGTSTPASPPSSTPPAAKSVTDMTAEEYAAAKRAKGYR